MIRRLRSLYRKTSLRGKVLFFFLLLSLVASVGAGLLFYYSAVASTRELLRENLEENLFNQSLIMNRVLDGMADYLDDVASHPIIREVMSHQKTGMRGELDDFQSLQKSLAVMSRPDYVNLKLYFMEETIYTREGQSYFYLGGGETPYSFALAQEAHGRIVWYGLEEREIVIARIIRDLSLDFPTLGYVEIRIDKKDLVNSWLKSTDGQVPPVIYRIKDHGGASVVTVGRENPGESYETLFYPLSPRGWILEGAVSSQFFINRYREILLITIAGSAVILLLVSLLALFFSENLTRRIKMLHDHMEMVQLEKDFEPLETSYADEISDLINAFNRLVESNRQLLKKITGESHARREAELTALQAQINPHLIYNTLDAVNWEALKQGAHEISEIVQGLSSFFRLSLSSGREIIPLKDEINHVKTYLNLEALRTKHRVEVNWDVPEGYLETPVLKLILQPLVENALIHGVREGQIERGVIDISLEVEAGVLIFTVEDNGKGMSDGQIRELLLKDAIKNGKSSYGVRNIQERIVLCYGEGYGLSYLSRRGRGTVVTIRLPVRREE